MKQTGSLKKNDTIELAVEGYSSEGSGVGHYNGQAVFVNGAAAGDTVECLIIKAKPNYAVGKIVHIIKASQDRVQPDCGVFPRCGGCQYRHITYEAEQRLKYKKVADAFARIGHLDVTPEPIVGADSPARYRNKAQYPVCMANGRLAAGFYAPFSHRVIDAKDCLLQPECFGAILKAVARWAEKYKIPTYDEATGKGLLRHVYLRRGFAADETMVCLVINGEKIFQQEALLAMLLKADASIRTVLLNHNTENTNVILGKRCTVLYGDGYIEDILCGKRFRISPLSFYQVNRGQAQRLYEKAAEFALADGAKTLLDLYCGAGTIGLTMADRVDKLIGVEIVPEAVADAKANAALNGIGNAEFLCADAATAAARLRERGVTPDVVILDPPRKGCDEALIDTVAQMQPKRVVYVSCDPATLARDCERLTACGYEVRTAVPFDLFPRTVHVETVALLLRDKATHHMKLDPAPYEMIKSGRKTIELRLFDEKRRKIKPGDTIVFTNTDTGETLLTTVLKLHCFRDFEELYQTLPLLRCGYTEETVSQAGPSDMERYYTPEEQKKYGVVGIELSRREGTPDEI